MCQVLSGCWRDCREWDRHSVAFTTWQWAACTMQSKVVRVHSWGEKAGERPDVQWANTNSWPSQWQGRGKAAERGQRACGLRKKGPREPVWPCRAAPIRRRSVCGCALQVLESAQLPPWLHPLAPGPWVSSHLCSGMTLGVSQHGGNTCYHCFSLISRRKYHQMNVVTLEAIYRLI